MQEKKRFVILLIVCVLIVAGIAVFFLLRNNRPRFHDDGVCPVVEQLLDQNSEQYDKSFLLGEKAGIAVALKEAYPYDIPEWYLLTETEQRKVVKEPIFTMDPAVSTWIFTEENEKYQFSCFEFHELDGKETVFIRVVPNFVPFEPFSQSVHYKDVPEDTSGTAPLCFIDARCMWGNPTWIYVIPLENIDESYCLSYAGFSLTGADILSGSWIPENDG